MLIWILKFFNQVEVDCERVASEEFQRIVDKDIENAQVDKDVDLHMENGTLDSS